MKGLVIGGVQSGSGKTTLTLALLAALRRRGLAVQPFKVGPDYIDPGHHEAVSGRPSHNLDGWMLPPAENLALFSRHTRDADVAVVEGVMGLYDGVDPTRDEGSTARLAKDLGLPVLLAADARATARTLAAVALGMARFDPEVRWAGLVGNRVGSARHADLLRRAMEAVPEIPWLGGLERREDLALPERHLGLVVADEHVFPPGFADTLADALEAAVDLDRLLDRLPAWTAPRDAPPTGNIPETVTTPADAPVIGVARDAAFCFYYHENLRRLEAAGARLAFFSPLSARRLPEGVAGLYLGGGYPELHAARLAANEPMRTAIRAFVRDGGVVYAECGGLMYLGRDLVDADGHATPMSGAFAWTSTMGRRRRALGYREIRTRRDSILGAAGTVARGHEFHYSDIPSPPDADLYETRDGRGAPSASWGWSRDRVAASYIHLHFGSCPGLAPALVSACRTGSFGFSLSPEGKGLG